MYVRGFSVAEQDKMRYTLQVLQPLGRENRHSQLLFLRGGTNVNELIWRDRFTDTRYRCDERWQAWVRRHLTDGLRQALARKDTVEGQANAAAGFWQEIGRAHV